MDKKIVFVIPSLGKGGAERSLYNFIKGIEELACVSVTVIVLNLGSHDYNELFSNKVKFIYLNLTRTIFPTSWIKLIKTINKSNPDLLISWSYIPNIIITLFKSYIITKKIYISERDATLHTVRHHTKGLMNILIPSIQRKLYTRANGLLLNSTQNLTMYRRFLKKENSFFYFIANAIPEEFKPQKIIKPSISKIYNSANPFKFLIVGRMVYQKGFDIVLEALAKISFKDYVLYAIGNGPEFENLRKRAKKLGISDKIVWLGSDIKPEQYYKQCDLLVFSSRHEGFPNVLLEGLINAIPVITSDCLTGPIEMTENGKLALVFKSGCLEDLILKIEHLYAQYPKFEEIAGMAQKKTIEKYNFQNIKKQYQSFILNSLAN